jgi:predicted DNA-binding protein with PD1-like motif
MGTRTWALIFSTGDEPMSGLQRFAEQNHLGGSHFTAIGAFKRVVLAWFDMESKQYQKIPIDEQVEVLSLIGDVSIGENGKPKVHAHVVVGKSDGSAHGGHLMEAEVRPTLEVILSESPRHLQRTHDPASGLALIDV